MGESSAASRVSSGAEEFERRMRSLDQSAATRDDPLAELARLVGQDDHFRGVNPLSRSPVAPFAAPSRQADLADLDALERRYRADPHAAGFSDVEEDFETDFTPTASEPPVFAPRVQSPYAPISVHPPRPIETSADAWARGDAMQASEHEPMTATREPTVRDTAGTSSRRTVIVLLAVVALTGGGLAASFLAKPSGSMSASAMLATPTILAATGPSKVQPEKAATDADAPSEPSSLLDKNKNDGTASAKVVDSVEQPVDLSQVIKPSQNAPSAEVSPPPASSSSPFPEPKKVKTVLIRPDGTVIADRPASVAGGDANTGITQEANLAFDPRTSLSIGEKPAAQTQVTAPPPASVTSVAMPEEAMPSVKTQTRVTATPKPVAPPKVKPVVAAVHTPVKPKPVVEADATPTPPPAEAETPPAASTGRFAVQLGAPPTEAEAKDVSSRLTRKFADQLGAYRPSIIKAEAGAKTVYRIRVGNLSQEDAKGLCSKLQAGGGGCFVIRN